MKVLVTGGNGQLGFDVVKCLKYRNIECVGTSRKDFDIIDEEGTRQYITSYHPDIVIHCSAYTAVDKAEDEEELCTDVNVKGTRNIANICKDINCKMVYISTDYVFSGTGINYYQTYDEPNPLSVYGKTKLAGENVVRSILDKYFILRISWVFGSNGNNFVKTMLRIGKNREVVGVVDDQVGSPTYTVDLAQLICDMIETNNYGMYHATNEGICSWADFAERIFEFAGYNTKVDRIKTKDYPTRAIRPRNSRLSKVSLEDNGFLKLPTWENALNRFMKDLLSN